MQNGPFIDDFHINTSIYKGFSMAMLNNQMVPFSFIFPNTPTMPPVLLLRDIFIDLQSGVAE
jgi:hypothetical protein